MGWGVGELRRWAWTSIKTSLLDFGASEGWGYFSPFWLSHEIFSSSRGWSILCNFVFSEPSMGSDSLGFHLSQKQGWLGMPRDAEFQTPLYKDISILGLHVKLQDMSVLWLWQCSVTPSVSPILTSYTSVFPLAPWNPACFHFGSGPLSSPHHLHCHVLDFYQ